MRATLFLFFIMAIGIGCQPKPIDPAKSAPKYPIQVQKFDSAFFEMDTISAHKSLQALMIKYPDFTEDFITKILMIKTVGDTQPIKAFYRAYLPVYKEVKKANAMRIAMPIMEEGFSHLHYFFPKYPLTHQVLTFVGPFESYGNIVIKDAVAVGLQMHLGPNSNWYFSDHIQTIYPTYLSRSFTPENMGVNSVANIVNDIVPQMDTGTLLTRMIETGKRQYILNACLPSLHDTVLFGYTKKQLNAVSQETSAIWNYIVDNKLTDSKDLALIGSLMREGLNNEVFGEAFPSNVGKYIGYQIVERWMQQKQQKNTTMDALLKMPADKIHAAAQYNP
jgi:hypothetical protein